MKEQDRVWIILFLCAFTTFTFLCMIVVYVSFRKAFRNEPAHTKKNMQVVKMRINNCVSKSLKWNKSNRYG